MSTELAIFTSGGAVSTAFADNDFTGSVASSSTKRISIRGGVFRRYDGKQEVDSIDDRFLNVVVVSASPSVQREFYEAGYVEGVDATPVCYSQDGNAPDPASEKRQSDKCGNCPQNQAGSGQGKSRACRFARRIGVVLANDIGGDVYAMKLPAMSIFGDAQNGYYPFQAYATFLKANKAAMPGVVTEMRFDKDSAVPKLFFKPIAQIKETDIPVVRSQMETEDAKRAIELKFTRAAASGGADVARPQVAGPTPTPTARPAAPAASTAPSGTALSSAVEDWSADE